MATINPDDLDTTNLNAQSNAEHIQGIYDDIQKMHEESFKARLGMPSVARVTLFTLGGSIVGGIGGMLSGWTDASLKYLAANSHRLPTSYNGWFFIINVRLIIVRKMPWQMPSRLVVKLVDLLV